MTQQQRIGQLFADRAIKPRIMTASYPGACAWCASPVCPGDQIAWCSAPVRISIHVDCLPSAMAGAVERQRTEGAA